MHSFRSKIITKHQLNRFCGVIKQFSSVSSDAQPRGNARVRLTTIEECMPSFHNLVEELTTVNDNNLSESFKNLNDVLLYNVPKGKKIRARSLVTAYKDLQSNENVTAKDMQLAYILGWCTEILHASLLINDDIMDSSEMRRGFECWYRVEGVGTNAINDALQLENVIFAVLKKHFSGHHCYLPAMKLFHDAIIKTYFGQSLDTLCMVNGVPKLNVFTMNRYKTIVKYKSCYYSFVLPVILAYYLAGKYNPELHKQASSILLELGYFCQVQDDFLDCFGDSQITGKQGTDIQDGKCSWLVVSALEKASPEERTMLQLNYGKSDPKCIEVIQNLYKKLNLHNDYVDYEKKMYDSISKEIQKSHSGLPNVLFDKILEYVYKRDK